MTNLTAALQTHFGFSTFRTGQAESIQSLLSGRHTLSVMPTGAGKSLIFQLAALLLGDHASPAPVALVISPLIALMKDQVDNLNRRGIPATYINSALPFAEQSSRLRQLAAGKFRLVYVAPERLRSTAFLGALRQRPICLLAVDEAHCISEWGHDFRPDYLNIASARAALGGPLTSALTATATPRVQSDILRLLGLGESSARIVTGFNRANLSLNVRYTNGQTAKLKALKELLLPQKSGAAIVYTGTRRDAEEVAEFAREVTGKPARCYHAGLPAEERERVQEDFIGGQVNLVAATNAFGMGIDRADVRQVVHFSLPGSLEAYYQECGRAGRDGLPAAATLLYDPDDRALQEFFIRQSELSGGDISAIYKALPPGDEIWVTLDDISRQIGLHPVQIKVGLSLLERTGSLEHLGDEGVRMAVKRAAWDAHQVDAAVLRGKQHAMNRSKELDSIVNYAESNGCRRRLILQHFGDLDATPVPDCCDNCRSRARRLGSALSSPAAPRRDTPRAAPPPVDTAQMSHGERAALIILDCIPRLKIRVGRDKLAKILHGSKAAAIFKYHYDECIYYAKLAAVPQSVIEDLIGQLVERGYIKVIGGQYPVLALTLQGENAVAEKEKIALKLPKSLDTGKLKRSQASADAGGTFELTAKLFSLGIKPEQIAAERGLAVTTIYGHLARLISAGRVSLDQVISAETRRAVEAAIQKVGSAQALTPIKMALPDSINFGEIKCVIAAKVRSSQPPAPAAPAAPSSSSDVDAFLIRAHPRPLPGLWAAGWSLGFHSRFSGGEWARSAVGDLTFRLKYNGDISTLPALVAQALELLKAHPELGEVDCLVPVPSTTQREVNPVQAFCEALSARIKLPVRPLVRKTRVTQPQKEMKTLAQKRSNVAGVFALSEDARHKRLLIVDDLFDSGATLEEITRLCLRGGAKCVNVFTLSCTIHSDL